VYVFDNSWPNCLTSSYQISLDNRSWGERVLERFAQGHSHSFVFSSTSRPAAFRPTADDATSTPGDGAIIVRDSPRADVKLIFVPNLDVYDILCLLCYALARRNLQLGHEHSRSRSRRFLLRLRHDEYCWRDAGAEDGRQTVDAARRVLDCCDDFVDSDLDSCWRIRSNICCPSARRNR